jgi:hypothetical protein
MLPEGLRGIGRPDAANEETIRYVSSCRSDPKKDVEEPSA